MQLGVRRSSHLILSCVIVVVSLFSQIARAADTGDLAAAWKDADKLSKTPIGNKYELEFFPAIAQTLADAVRNCGGSDKKPYKFDMVLFVSADGHIIRSLYPPNQPIAACIAAKLKGKKGPRPPRDSWPVGARFDNK